MVSDGFSHMFAFAGMLLGIPVVGSFHTDLMDLLNSHHANAFQKAVVNSKERLDSYVFDSCATTSRSFLNKLAKLNVNCQHTIITAVDIDTFQPSKRNRCA